jgi:hypothetical protein
MRNMPPAGCGAQVGGASATKPGKPVKPRATPPQAWQLRPPTVGALPFHPASRAILRPIRAIPRSPIAADLPSCSFSVVSLR